MNGPINLSRLFNLYDQTPRPDLKFPLFAPRELEMKPGAPSIFELVRKRSVLLHHPYDSYSAVVRFIESAAHDPDVLSIKQTLYRTSENSPIVRALIEAAAKKEVAVVVELKARFDEASNIRWARNLQEAGVQVFHGVVGLKTHCKLALSRVANPTARFAATRISARAITIPPPRASTPISACSPATRSITHAVHHVFNYLTAYSERRQYTPLFVAPLNLGKNVVSLIDRETAHARAGRPAFIVAKVNSLLDEKIIQALYRASQAGVTIELIVRGACALRPGVRGISSRIRVRSVIGRFLEHSRIFAFGNGGKTEDLSRQRGLDAAEYLRARRGDVPAEGSGSVRPDFDASNRAVSGGYGKNADSAARTANTSARIKRSDSPTRATGSILTRKNS